MRRPADKYEQRLERIAAALRAAVAAHDVDHECGGAWCDYRLDAVEDVLGVAFLPGEAEAFLADCPYIWEWWLGDLAPDTVRDAVVSALETNARERLYHAGGDPFVLTLLDPEETWDRDET